MWLVAKMVMRNICIIITASPVTLDAWEPTYTCDYTQSNDRRGKMSRQTPWGFNDTDVLGVWFTVWVCTRGGSMKGNGDHCCWTLGDLLLLAFNDKSQKTWIFLKVASELSVLDPSQAPLFCDFLRVDGKKKCRILGQRRGLSEKENLPSGANRSDPCSRSPSFPLARCCVALGSSHIFCQRVKRGGWGVEN